MLIINQQMLEGIQLIHDAFMFHVSALFWCFYFEVSVAVQPHVHNYYYTRDLCVVLRLLADFLRYFSTKKIKEQAVSLQTVN